MPSVYSSAEEKKNNNRAGDVSSGLSILPPTARIRLFIPPPIPPSGLHLTDSRPCELLFWEETQRHTSLNSHTPTQHLIRRQDRARQLLWCVLTGRCWPLLARECVQGFGGQLSAAVSAPRCGLCLTSPTKRNAHRIAAHMCTAQ